MGERRHSVRPHSHSSEGDGGKGIDPAVVVDGRAIDPASISGADIVNASASEVLQSDGDGTLSFGALPSDLFTDVETLNPSSVATVDLTNGFNATDVIVWVRNMKPATDAVGLQLRTSPDGSTFDSGASDYWSGGAEEPGTTDINVNGQSEAVLTANGIGNAAGEYGISGELRLYNVGASAETHGVFNGLYHTSSDDVLHVATGFFRAAAEAVQGCQLFFSSGNIASGEVQVVKA